MKNQQANKLLLDNSSIPNSIKEEIQLSKAKPKELFESNKDAKASEKIITDVNVIGTQPKTIKLNFKTIPAAQVQNNSTNNNIECIGIILIINSFF